METLFEKAQTIDIYNKEHVADTVDLFGKTWTIEVYRQRSVNKRAVHPRVFVWGVPNPEDVGGPDKPPYSIKGDDPDNDAAWRRYNRKEVKIMREFLAAAGFPNMQHSRTAGCRCGCSPGFIFTDGGWRDYSVEIKSEENDG